MKIKSVFIILFLSLYLSVLLNQAMEEIIKRFSKSSGSQILRLSKDDEKLYNPQLDRLFRVYSDYPNLRYPGRLVWICEKVEPNEALRQELGVDAEFWDAKLHLEQEAKAEDKAEAKAEADEPWIRVTKLPVIRVVPTVPKNFFEFVGTKVIGEVTFQWIEFNDNIYLKMGANTGQVIWSSNMTLAGCGNAYGGFVNPGFLCDKAWLPKLSSALSQVYAAWESVVQVVGSDGSLRLEKPPVELKVVEDVRWRVTYQPSLNKLDETVTSLAEVVAFAQTLSSERTKLVLE
jgi:hypothetical protein